MQATVEGIERLVKSGGDVLTIPSGASVLEAARKMREHHVGCLVVLDEQDKVTGILTERDVTRKVVAVSADPAGTTVADIMTRKVISCAASTSIPKAEQIMAQHEIRHLPIIEEGVLVGMISSRDVLAHQLSTVKAIARRQLRVLNELEDHYPGITQLRKDRAGRIVI